jgi:hypothetical protein
MNAPDLKPWSLRPLGTGLVVLFVAFLAAVAGLMAYTLPTMQATLVSKGLIFILVMSALGCALTLFMWTRYWPDVAWDTSFWRFISEPAPPENYPEALQAWRWGRRYMACWILILLSMLLIPVVEHFADR